MLCASFRESNPSSRMDSHKHSTSGWQRRKYCKGYLCLGGNTRPRNSHFWSCRSGTAERVYCDCRSEAQKHGMREKEFSLVAGRRIIQKKISLFSFFFSLYITNSNGNIPQLQGKTNSERIPGLCKSWHPESAGGRWRVSREPLFPWGNALWSHSSRAQFCCRKENCEDTTLVQRTNPPLRGHI